MSFNSKFMLLGCFAAGQLVAGGVLIGYVLGWQVGLGATLLVMALLNQGVLADWILSDPRHK